MGIGVSCGGRVRGEPHLYKNGRGIHGWRGTKEEMKERKAFKKLPASTQAFIEEEKPRELRETMNGLLD